jgi:hypothetical protein
VQIRKLKGKTFFWSPHCGEKTVENLVFFYYSIQKNFKKNFFLQSG